MPGLCYGAKEGIKVVHLGRYTTMRIAINWFRRQGAYRYPQDMWTPTLKFVANNMQNIENLGYFAAAGLLE